MNSLWDEQQAALHTDDLAQRVYSSRLLGSDPSLVLHGGGNTSVKISQPNLLGETEEILYVKGSGWDLATIEAAGFTPLRIAHLVKLAQLEQLSDLQMVNELKTQQTIASAPTGSVEAILHAVLPHKFVDHTHADAVVTITNTRNGEQRIRQIYGEQVVIVPYIMPGFDLAREVARLYAEQATAQTIGMVLMNHGIFSFGANARDSYLRMIELVDRAERYLQQQGAWSLPTPPSAAPANNSEQIAALRQQLCEVAGQPLILSSDRSDRALQFCRRSDLERISQQGPATPDHVIRTKRLPLLGRDVAGYRDAYRAYFEQHAATARTPVTMLTPTPGVILDPELGMLTLGKGIKEALISADLYRHTMDIIERAERLGGWQALPARDIFDLEYWELEQAKLRRSGATAELQGRIALVTGAASGIGAACVDSLLARGAAVVGLDITPTITTLHQRSDFLGLQCDVTDSDTLAAALQQTVSRFGGLDLLILNAGIFPASNRIEALQDALWRQVMSVNLDANLRLLRESHPLLKRAPAGGRVVIIGSKNVPAPGPGAAAYSAAKAALNQLARVAALEWGAEGIRVNTLHPDAVFDTAIWSDEILQARADHYGLSIKQYKSKNLLQTEVSSHNVAELAAAMCGALFDKTTGAQLPVDGGNDRVI